MRKSQHIRTYAFLLHDLLMNEKGARRFCNRIYAETPHVVIPLYPAAGIISNVFLEQSKAKHRLLSCIRAFSYSGNFPAGHLLICWKNWRFTVDTPYKRCYTITEYDTVSVIYLVQKGPWPFWTKGLQSAARIICSLKANKFHTCRLRRIFAQVHAPGENGLHLICRLRAANSARLF